MKKGGIIIGSIGVLLAAVGIMLDGFSKISDVISPENEVIEPVMMNEPISDKDGVEFCVTGVENTQLIEGEFSSISTDNNYIVVYLTITNKGNEPYDVNSIRFVLMEGDNEYEYLEDSLLLLDDIMYMDTINPNLSESYILVYETLTTTNDTEYKLKVKSNAYSDKDNVYILLKSE